MSWRHDDSDPLEVLTAMFDAPCMLPRQRRTLWTIPHWVRPALSGVRHGTGDLLIGLTPIFHRPSYYLVWIDAAWWPRGGYLDAERIDPIWEALEEEFGRRARKDDGDFYSRYEWPEVDDEGGCAWWRARPDDILTATARRRLIPSWDGSYGVSVPGDRTLSPSDADA